MGCWLLALPANSQKVVTRSTTVGIGGTNILDTYLSDEHFKGTGVSILSTIERQQPDCRWSTLMEHEANLSLCNGASYTVGNCLTEHSVCKLVDW